MQSTFEALGLSQALITGLEKESITVPTPIQAGTIPYALKNQDIVGRSVTGSGKTLAYLLPIFEKVDAHKKEMQAIILAPTHELVVQINRQIQALAVNAGIPMNSATIMGEVNIKRQVEKLKEKPQIIVGSSGRILELIKLKKINAHTVKTIVIDEGDRLLDENNVEGVKSVIKATQKDRQLMVFSATINDQTLQIAREFMKEPAVVQIDETPVNSQITHLVIRAEQREKIEVLRKLLVALQPKKALVFLNRNDKIQMTVAKLQHHQIKAAGIYGDAAKEDRKKAMDDFTYGRIQILVASDLAARGLDIKGLTHIINMDLPPDEEGYLHRVGRTGRAGNAGTAISLVTEAELPLIKKLELRLGVRIEQKDVYKARIISPRRGKPSSAQVKAPKTGDTKPAWAKNGSAGNSGTKSADAKASGTSTASAAEAASGLPAKKPFKARTSAPAKPKPKKQGRPW